MFIKQVQEQLCIMSESEKDEWILTQARLVKENRQEDFLMSLSGKKKISYMPTPDEITSFCKRVEQGEIYLEYETHYYEFDSEGNYMGDWETWYNDPLDAFSFLGTAFNGCHDLLRLEEYASAADILDQLCALEFEVAEAPDSEDFDAESPISLAAVAEEGLLPMNIEDIGRWWITAYWKQSDRYDTMELAIKLVDLFNHPVCQKNNPDILIDKESSYDLYSHMQSIISAQIKEVENTLRTGFSDSRYYHERYALEEKLKRQKELLLNLEMRLFR